MKPAIENNPSSEEVMSILLHALKSRQEENATLKKRLGEVVRDDKEGELEEAEPVNVEQIMQSKQLPVDEAVQIFRNELERLDDENRKMREKLDGSGESKDEKIARLEKELAQANGKIQECTKEIIRLQPFEQESIKRGKVKKRENIIKRVPAEDDSNPIGAWMNFTKHQLKLETTFDEKVEAGDELRKKLYCVSVCLDGKPLASYTDKNVETAKKKAVIAVLKKIGKGNSAESWFAPYFVRMGLLERSEAQSFHWDIERRLRELDSPQPADEKRESPVEAEVGAQRQWTPGYEASKLTAASHHKNAEKEKSTLLKRKG